MSEALPIDSLAINFLELRLNRFSLNYVQAQDEVPDKKKQVWARQKWVADRGARQNRPKMVTLVQTEHTQATPMTTNLR